ncbi:MAG: peptidase domain-containing ABC transporter [Nostocaceae cyanobacterium]|nr:peptidase domain-containing ABC transporter [Nostocaceae cyanobacterium]
MKYKFVKQSSEEDCGAACVASIAKYYGRNVALNRIREAIGTGQQGTTLLGLRRGTEALGFNSQSYQISPALVDKLQEEQLPAIIHWKGNHWVVLYGRRANNYIIADTAIGIRYIDKQELIENWQDGVFLLLKPDKNRFDTQPEHQENNFRKYLQDILPYRGIIFEALLCSLVIGLLSLTYPFFLQILTDDVLVRGDTEFMTAVVLAVIIMYIVTRCIGLIENILIGYFAQRFQLNLMLEFGQQILRLPLTYYESRRSGEIVSRLQDIEEINQLISQAIINFPVRLLIAGVCLVLMLFYSWSLTILALVIASIMTISTIMFLPILQQKTRTLMVLEAETQGVLVETFKGALTLKTTTSAFQFWQEFQKRFSTIARLALNKIQIEIINKQFSGLVSDIGIIILLWTGSGLVFTQKLSIGQLLAFISLNRNVVSLLDFIIDFIDEFINAQTALSRLQEVLTFTPETQDNSKDKIEVFPITGTVDILCENINFHYPGREELLADFSLKIPGGQVIALVGKSGCGKSTLAKLIAGLYQPQSGNIYFGNCNQQDIPLDDLRRHVALVPQNPHFWSRSITENFSLGNPNVTEEQIKKACKIAQIDTFIDKLPAKYATVLGEFGVNLSGGQLQRLAIARAIVHDPPILILDESSAGLDPVSENEVFQALLQYRCGQTTILISHRRGVNNRADWIVLLEEGKVKRQGTKEDLHPLQDVYWQY